jgi:sugar lactone lactonase YvrE
MQCRFLTSLPAVTLLCALTASQVSAHPSSGIVIDQNGHVFFTDSGGDGFLWKIDPGGKRTLVRKGRLQGLHWLTLDEKGLYSGEDLKKWFDRRIIPNFGRVALSGSRSALLQTDGCPVVVGPDGTLYFAKENVEISRLSPDGTVTLLNSRVRETTKKFGFITGLASSRDGSVYAACPNAILKVKSEGMVTTLVHPTSLKHLTPDLDTPGDHEPLLRGLAVDSRGAIYAAATGFHCVVRITADGKVETVLKAERPWSPTGVAVHDQSLYVLEYTNAESNNHEEWLTRVRKLGSDGKITTLTAISKEDRER